MLASSIAARIEEVRASIWGPFSNLDAKPKTACNPQLPSEEPPGWERAPPNATHGCQASLGSCARVAEPLRLHSTESPAKRQIGRRVRHGTLVAEGLTTLMPALLNRLGQRGSVAVEYLLVLAFAGILVTLAVVPVLGPAIVDEYTIRRAILYSTYP